VYINVYRISYLVIIYKLILQISVLLTCVVIIGIFYWPLTVTVEVGTDISTHADATKSNETRLKCYRE